MHQEVAKATVPAGRVRMPEKKSFWYVRLSRDCEREISVVDDLFSG